MSQLVDRRVEVRGADGAEADESPASKPPGENLALNDHPRRPEGILEDQGGAHFQLLARMDQRVPDVVRIAFVGNVLKPGGLEQQALDRASARIAPTEESSGKDARVIDHDEVARIQELRQIPNRGLMPRFGRPVDREEPRGPARPCGLGDQRRRQIKIEIGDVHPPLTYSASLVAARRARCAVSRVQPMFTVS